MPIVVAIVAALASMAAASLSARSNRSGQQDQLQFAVWKDSVAELRTRVDELEGEVEKCHIEKDAQADELGGMREANTELRRRIGDLEHEVKTLKEARP